ncbi:MAG: hypothetical protein OEZ39_10670 [Gammaproteobacteria bacterium]|nr:hypothetical protein [Gammaproteobacteria bacterium]MDH5652306.1 hypothetical protein [Gammaproteobacteria bacterium]
MYKNSIQLLFVSLIGYCIITASTVVWAQQKQVAPTDKSTAAKKKPKPVDIRKLILQNPGKIPQLLQKGQLTPDKIPNPHWQADGCTACHTGKASKTNLRLRDKDIDRMCNTCHTELSAHSYIHVSDIKVPKAMLQRMPGQFRNAVKRDANKLTCITCHDLPMTCKKERKKEQGANPMFFRAGPYDSRSGLCYHCHDATKYQRMNAHKQIADNGKLLPGKCELCHKTTRNLADAVGIGEVDFQVTEDLSRLCWGCHRWKPHPGGSFTFFSGQGGTPNHLVKPSARIQERMREMQEKNAILFPLEPGTGKVFCGTCHNPHQEGVIKNKAAAKGADSNKRLRMQEICINCHDK